MTGKMPPSTCMKRNQIWGLSLHPAPQNHWPIIHLATDVDGVHVTSQKNTHEDAHANKGKMACQHNQLHNVCQVHLFTYIIYHCVYLIVYSSMFWIYLHLVVRQFGPRSLCQFHPFGATSHHKGTEVVKRSAEDRRICCFSGQRMPNMKL